MILQQTATVEGFKGRQDGPRYSRDWYISRERPRVMLFRQPPPTPPSIPLSLQNLLACRRRLALPNKIRNLVRSYV